ncbi:MAG: response regulator [Magnetococcales bacterium]|nr:response regulator [Magnetococcales bacterium]
MEETVKPDSPVARILLVDDEEITERLLRRIITPETNLALFYCQNPLQAIQMAEQIRPVLILTDLLMPEMDGLTLIRQFRNRRAFAQLPIIMLSSEEDPYVKAQAFAAGANDYLVKLPSTVEMVARLQHHAQYFFLRSRQKGNKELCSDIIHSDLKGFWIIDARTQQIIEVNDSLCAMLGYSRESLIQKTPLDFVDADNRPLMQKALDWIPKEDKRIHEIHLQTLMQSGLYTRFCVTISPNTLGRELVAVFTFLNLDKLNQEYFEILKNEFRFIANSVPGLLWLSNPSHERIFFNQSWLTFRGVMLEQELNNGWLHGVHPEDLERYQYFSNEAFVQRHPYSQEFRLRNGRGEYCWIYETALPRFAGNGFFMGFSGSCLDISERKLIEGRMHQVNYSLEQQIYLRTTELRREVQERRQAEAEERRSKQAQGVVSALLRLALEGAPLAEQLQQSLQTILAVPWLTTQKKGAIFLADAASQSLNLVAAEALPTTFCIACAQVPFGHCLCGRVAASGVALHVNQWDLYHVHANHAEEELSHGHYCLPILSGSKVLGVLNLYVDENHSITPFEEEFLRTVTDMLTVLIEHAQINQLQLARQQAEAASQAKGDFLATMSHEIRTPLNVVLGVLELLHASPQTQSGREQIQLALGSGKMLLYLINDILDYSKIEAGQLTLDLIPFDLRTLLDTVAFNMSPLASAKKVELTSFFPQELPVAVRGDPNRLSQILTNLIGNAIKFTPPGGMVEFHGGLVCREGEWLEFLFEIRDTGIGVPEKEREHIFERFAQAHAGDPHRYGGTGLGLSICQRLVALMQGSIGVDDNLFADSGSSFYFTVRLLQQSQLPADRYQSMLRGVRVLIVGSQGLQLALLHNALQAWGVHFADVSQLETACGEMAQAARRGAPYALVIINQRPEPLNPQALSQCTSTHPGAAFLLLIDRLDQGLDQASELPGDTLCLKKPFSLDQLHAMLSTLLHLEDGSKPPPEKESSPSARAGYRMANILVVDDQVANLTVTLGMLVQAGCDRSRCMTALNGEEAINRFKQTPFNLVFMDCQMPVMNGYQATQHIRAWEQQQGLPAVPVIAFTADVSRENRQAGLSAGMNDFLTKPTLLEDFQRLLERYLGGMETKTPRSVPAPPAVQDRADVQSVITALQALGLGEEDIPSIAELITEQLPELLNTLEMDLREARYEQARAVSHVVRGSMIHTVFPVMQRETRKMHEAVRDQDWEQALQQLAKVRLAFAPIYKALVAWLARSKEAS